MKQPRPNVLIAGFPKCGSTSFYHALKQHPDIHIPPIKELNYFNKNAFFLADPHVPNPRSLKPLSWYYSFFNSPKQARIDFSILTALDANSPLRVKRVLGDIPIVFITRNKDDYLRSLNNFMKKEGRVYPHAEDYAHFDYYINNFKHHFSRVHVLTLENFNKHFQKEMNKLTDFLSLARHTFTQPERQHTTTTHRMSLRQRLKRETYFKLSKLFDTFARRTVTAKLKAQGEK